MDASAETMPRGVTPAGPQVAPGSATLSRWRQFPVLPFLMTVVFMGFVFLPKVRDNPRLTATYLGVGGLLLLGELIVWLRALRRGEELRSEVAIVRVHWVQAIMHTSVFAYWGWYVRDVYAEYPLILSQVVFLFVFDALISWWRGRSWRIGFGPLPIIFSTNLLLWFRDDWFVFQFLMVAMGALGKQFVTWNREGRKAHIFNPSVFGQSILAVAMIVTGTTAKFSLGQDIAGRFGTPPHIYLEIFVLGLIVQYLFHVTLMTLSAAATLAVFNLIYTHFTGSYFFAVTNIGAPVFLGLHLLMTDPSTSPRSNTGRVLFGVLYALGYAFFFRFLDDIGSPPFWDKLLPVPILNLCVPLIDRWARSGPVGRFNRWWEESFPVRKANLVHMGVWVAVFGTMWGTGFIEAPHPGNSLAYWKQAYAEGKPHAGPNLIKIATYAASQGSASACIVMGDLLLEGKAVEADHDQAARYYAEAVELGSSEGCVKLLQRFFFHGDRVPGKSLDKALDQLERECPTATNGDGCDLVGLAYLNGENRPVDKARAKALFQQACDRGNADACQRLGR